MEVRNKKKGIRENSANLSRSELCSTTGFATLEILLALTIIILALSATFFVSSSNQSLLADNSINEQALQKAENVLHTAQTNAVIDFKLVNATSTTDGTYIDSLSVSTADFFVKKVTATVTWRNTYNVTRTVSEDALMADFENENGGDTCDSTPNGDWIHPQIKNSISDFGQLIGDTVGTYPITDIDAYKNKLYITIGSTAQKTDPTFFVFDISNSTNPFLIANAKLDTSTTTATGGLHGVIVAENTVSQKLYAYVANAHSGNFTTCVQGQSCSQLQIIDVTDPSHLSLVYSLKLNNVIGIQGVGQSIFYKNGLVYVGLASTGSGNGPEFHIIDVHDPLHPVRIGSYAIGSTINAIFVSGAYAYLVHPSSSAYNEQITVLDIHDPTNPFRTAGFFGPEGIGGNGKSLYTVGTTLYMGRTATNISGPADMLPEFYTLDISNPLSLPPPLGSVALSASKDSVNGVLVRDNLLFFLTNSQLQIRKIIQGTPLSFPQYATPLNLPASGSTFEPSLDCEGNYLYIGSNNASNKGFLSVISAP